MKYRLITWGLAAVPAVVLGSVLAAPPVRVPAPATATAPTTAGASAIEAVPASAPATAAASAPASALATAASAEAPVERRSGRGGYGGYANGGRSLPADYDVLNRKSIFSKDRRRADRRSFDGNGGSFAVRPPQTPVFIGTVLEDDGFVGFIESPDSGQLVQIRRGDKLPNGLGTVAELSLDFVDVAPEGDAQAAPRRVAIGQNLLGGVPAAPAATTQAAGAEGAATSTAPASSGGTNDLIERLRRRRQQELGR
jgi:hypothetical protein